MANEPRLRDLNVHAVRFTVGGLDSSKKESFVVDHKLLNAPGAGSLRRFKDPVASMRLRRGGEPTWTIEWKVQVSSSPVRFENAKVESSLSAASLELSETKEPTLKLQPKDWSVLRLRLPCDMIATNWQIGAQVHDPVRGLRPTAWRNAFAFAFTSVEAEGDLEDGSDRRMGGRTLPQGLLPALQAAASRNAAESEDSDDSDESERLEIEVLLKHSVEKVQCELKKVDKTSSFPAESSHSQQDFPRFDAKKPKCQSQTGQKRKAGEVEVHASKALDRKAASALPGGKRRRFPWPQSSV